MRRSILEILAAVHLVHLNINETLIALHVYVYSTRECVTGVNVNMQLWGPSISSGLQVTSRLLNLSPVIPFECVHSL